MNTLHSHLATALHDERRLAALREALPLGNSAHTDFDRLTNLAARVLRVPVTYISLIEADRQEVLSWHGSPQLAHHPSDSYSICTHMVASHEPIIIPVLREASAEIDSAPFIEQGFEAYLGFPLITGDGFVLGSFCALDTDAHAWSDDDIASLRDLAAAASTGLELWRDIHRRERVEAELHEYNARFASAFSNAAIGMALVGLDGRWIQVNPALCKLLGYEEAELMSIPFRNLTHPADLEKDMDNHQRMARGEQSTYRTEKRYIHKRGRLVWAELSVSLIYDVENQPLYIVSQIIDISARKQGEWERERLIEQLSEALDSVKVLQGLLPICSGCKKIRDDSGYWNQLEGYIQRYADVHFSHGICPSCVQKLYPDIADPAAKE
ncbi:hypothetical protein SE17_21290 [Kouleothrix aurantiaca]|uniref:Histidine kinase n=1 Tax=Kouleothrix aurantiaca TaxID=186479 RepID=A0A0P9D0D4_9CHLR|nr:hypothetical protein SE17_21290 [Kouleothrix aurantiaca]